jgi:signal transduction histidine kinase
LDWWFDRVHEEDKQRVRNNVNDAIEKGISHWKDEYRFKCADGSYKYLLDSGIILYKNGKPVRIIGAIQDLTKRKELEERLLKDEIQKQKQLRQAAISAQEEERNKISRELHDNVNQIIMSAKLFMDTAKKHPEQANEMLDKAMEYQVLALQEIRTLSKTLNTSLLKTVGLKDSIEDIVRNMQNLKNMDVQFQFNSKVEKALSDEQRLILYRVVQEQTSNIIKYAEAKSVKILINESHGIIHLIIHDDGKGFNLSEKRNGIGLSNIFSRADAYNGKVHLISSPGNGCMLEFHLPVKG